MQWRDVMRLFVHVYAPTKTDLTKYNFYKNQVSACFANACSGKMATHFEMAAHDNPVVSNTAEWALSLMAGVMPRQPDAYSCVKVHVEENGGQVHLANIGVLWAQMGVNGVGVDVLPLDMGEEEEEEEEDGEEEEEV